MNSNDASAATAIDIVDDVELLAILGLSAPSSPTLCDNNTSIAVLDWEDMPELSEEEDEDDSNSINTNNKRKYNDEDEDIFAEFDFVEVSIQQPPEKKQKTLLIQQPFVSEDSESILSSSPNVQLNEEDIRLALDLISST